MASYSLSPSAADALIDSRRGPGRFQWSAGSESALPGAAGKPGSSGAAAAAAAAAAAPGPGPASSPGPGPRGPAVKPEALGRLGSPVGSFVMQLELQGGSVPRTDSDAPSSEVGPGPPADSDLDPAGPAPCGGPPAVLPVNSANVTPYAPGPTRMDVTVTVSTNPYTGSRVPRSDEDF